MTSLNEDLMEIGILRDLERLNGVDEPVHCVA
jgi:hypothetical protein